VIKKVLVGAALATIATATAPSVAMTSQAAGVTGLGGPCHAERAGNHWTCVTPGAHCAAAGQSGEDDGHRYTCARYADGRWRWRRA
jgi:hypothetical protein